MPRDTRGTDASDRSLGLPRSIAVLLWACVLVATAATAFAVTVTQPPGQNGPQAIYFTLVFIVLVFGMGSMGTLVSIRRPDNPIGWLFVAAAVLIGASMGSGSYVSLSVADAQGLHGLWPATAFMGWLSSWPFAIVIAILVFFVPLLFPTGSLPSPRWRIVALFGGIAALPAVIGPALYPGPLADTPSISNPFGVPGAAGLLDTLTAVSNVLTAPLVLAVPVSLVIRYRRGSAIERQQIKWFAYPAIVAAACFAFALPQIGPLADLQWAIGIGALAALPIAIGIAILRYRLFEIDRLINRTIVYAALTALLIGLELGGILILRTILEPITGETNIAVAATTLGVAALFQPLRRRVQLVVDRRFYRSRYDADKVIARFATHLRDEVQLASLANALRTATTEALQPRTVSLWMRRGPNP